jgi:hypothetical protein
VPQDSPGLAATGSDPVGLREGDPVTPLVIDDNLHFVRRVTALGHRHATACRRCAHPRVSVARRRADTRRRRSSSNRPVRWPPLLSLVTGGDRCGGRKRKWHYGLHASGLVPILFSRRMRTAVDLRWMTGSVFGPDLAQVGESIFRI